MGFVCVQLSRTFRLNRAGREAKEKKINFIFFVSQESANADSWDGRRPYGTSAPRGAIRSDLIVKQHEKQDAKRSQKTSKKAGGYVNIVLVFRVVLL